tara:strand:+ start:5616 stop:5888 length:273 start_codon:yes stop_codon:yes gene_type:complete
METDIGNPIQYNPDLKEDERSVQEEDVYYQPPPPAHMMYPSMMQQPPPMVENTKLDFSNLDKNTYIVMFIAFIVGFFMGKTMQPVILRAM